VTLGTGQMPNISFAKEGTGWWSNLKGTLKVGMSLLNLASTSERTHLDAMGIFDNTAYFRFNLGTKVGEKRWIERVYPPKAGWLDWSKVDKHMFQQEDWKDLEISLDDHKKMDELVSLTDEHLKSDAEKQRIMQCRSAMTKAGDIKIIAVEA
jgi:hypothetical protein